MRFRQATCATALGAALAMVAAPACMAGPITFTAASDALAAAVTFEVIAGSRLQVVLTNVATTDVVVPADILTGVYFSGGDALVPLSARLGAGSAVVYGAADAPSDGVVGGEWGFAGGIAGVPNGGTAALMSTGALAGLGQANFPGANLAGPAGLGGLQFGLLSAGDDAATGNGGITGSGGLVRNAVTFTFTGLPPGFALESIGNVSFQYGTSLAEPILHGAPPASFVQGPVPTPEPATMAVLGVGMIAVGLLRRRRR